MATVPSCAAGVPIFRALSETGLLELGSAMQHRSYARGERVVAAGDPISHLIVVASGQLKLVHTTSSGREQVVRYLGPGEFLGEMALFTQVHHEGDLVALEESTACLISREGIQAIMRQHPAVALAVVEALAQRLSEAEQLIADLGLRDVGQRLAAELIRLAGPQASPSGQAVLRLTVPWSEMAFRLGTTPESLSRRLRVLVEQGLVEQEGSRTLRILDLKRLRRLAEA